MDGEERVGHRHSGVTQHVIQPASHLLEHDLPGQGIAVGVQTRGRVAQQDVPRHDPVAMQGGVLLDYTDDGAGQIVGAGPIEPGHLGRLPAGERHVVPATAPCDTLNDSGDLFDAQRRARDVVHEGDGSRAMHQDVVDAVVDEVLAHGVEPPGLEGDEHFGAHAVGAQDQRRPPHARRDPDHPAECPDMADRKRRPGSRHQLADPRLGRLRALEIHARRRVLAVHGMASATATWVRS